MSTASRTFCQLIRECSALGSVLYWAPGGRCPHNSQWWSGFNAGVHWHGGAHRCSVPCHCQMSLWLDKDLRKLKPFHSLFTAEITKDTSTHSPSDLLSSEKTLTAFDVVYLLLQDTALALWIPCTVLSGFEAGLSVWCFVVGLGLRGLAPCVRNYIKEQVCVCVCVRGSGPHWSQAKS